MKEFTLPIIRVSRIFTGIMIVSFVTPIFWLPILSENLSDKEILFRLSIVVVIILLVYFLVSGRMFLRYSGSIIEFEWKRKPIFDNKNNDSVNVNDVKTLVVDQNIFLRKIITSHGEVEISNTRPVTKEFELFIKNLKKQVKGNGGRVVDSKQIQKEKGYYDLSYSLFAASSAIVIFLIDRLWGNFNFATLVLLIVPVIFYLRHVRLRKNKKGKC